MSDVDWYAMLRVTDTNLFFCRLDDDLTFNDLTEICSVWWREHFLTYLVLCE